MVVICIEWRADTLECIYRHPFKDWAIVELVAFQEMPYKIVIGPKKEKLAEETNQISNKPS